LGAAVVGVGFSLGKTAAEAARMETAFQSLAAGAGQSGDEMLAALQKASKGTISNKDLMLNANRAILLGVADTGEEMAKLLEVATARGRALGLSTQQAFGDIVTGLGRESKLILDNLGIMVDVEKVQGEYAKSLGKTASSLSDAERKQALLNAVLRDSADIVAASKDDTDDAAANFERMDASIQNAKVALGELFGPAVAIVAQSIADAAVAASEGLEEVGEALRGNSAPLKENVSAIQALQAKTKTGSEEWIRYQLAINAMTGTMDQAVAGQNDIAWAMDQVATGGTQTAHC